MEYDRNQNDYSATSPSGDYFTYVRPSLAGPGGIVPGYMSSTNKAEVDCLMCHLNDNSGTSGNGRAWLQSMGCSSSNPMGPINDPECSGTSTMPGVTDAGPFIPGTKYDSYNRNLAIKTKQPQYAASLGIGATATGFTPNADGTLTINGITGVPATILAADIQATPNSQNCAVCHARDDNTPGLPGMVNMKYGYGNYALISPAGTALDTDKTGTGTNDVLWFELGCKTGMGKRGHRIGAGPNDKWGMSMFNALFGLGKNPGDPVVDQTWDFSSMGMGTLIVKERIPDQDVHDAGGMQCATCHYTLGSSLIEGGSKTIPATEFGEGAEKIAFPSKTINGIDHQFAKFGTMEDTNSMPNLDGTVSCESCHTTRTNPRLTDNGGTLVAPTPTHASFPAAHLQKISCTTCHIPEVYAAPGRLKYRDYTLGYYKMGTPNAGAWRNMLDWNYDLVTGSHTPVPPLHAWATRNGKTQIIPILPSAIPIWEVDNNNSATEAGSEAAVSGKTGSCDGTDAAHAGQACAVNADCGTGTCNKPDLGMSDLAFFVANPGLGTSPAPANALDTLNAAKTVEHTTSVLRRGQDGNEINGGNMVPLFDGFSLADAFGVDTKARIDAMYNAGAGSELRIFQAGRFDVTHGVVPKEWALGGSKRGGCTSCHSSIDPYSRNAMGMPTGPNSNYSQNSVGFFEGFQQPLEKAAFGIGQYDLLKNWFSLFADFDCTMMCGGGTQPDSTYFDPAGNPINGAACGDPFGMGWSQLGDCVGFMTQTFDAAMGFPSGTAMMMGMYDGIAGLQGFVVRETVSGSTLGCQPFAGSVNSPVAQAFGVNVNNCMPAAFSGACTGPQSNPMWPASCVGGFRDGQGCATDGDCAGTLDATEATNNPNGLIYSRAEVRDHFKIALQQSCGGACSGDGGVSLPGLGAITYANARLTWPIGTEKNPDNPAHINAWDQAGKLNVCGPFQNEPCCTDASGAPTTCADGTYVETTIHENQLLGFTGNKFAELTNINLITNPGSVPVTGETDCTACHNGSSIIPTSLQHSPVSGLIAGLSDATSCKTCHLAGGQTAHTGSVVDIDLTCGQCHGGSQGPGATTNGAPYLSEANLAPYASAVHGGTVVGGPVPPAEILPPTPGSCDGTIQATGTTGCALVGGLETCDIATGGTVTLSGPLADQAGTQFVYWGDGSGIETATAGMIHTYDHIGKYQIHLTVKNPCGYSVQKIMLVDVTGGVAGKGTLSLSFSGTTATAVSYSVLNGSGVSITSGSLNTLAPSKDITLDVAADYSVKIGFQSKQPLTDPVTYHVCTVAGSTPVAKCSMPAYTLAGQTACETAGGTWQVTGALIDPVAVALTPATTVTVTCD